MTPQQIEAMKLALEALYPIAHNTTDDPRGQAYKAITALEEVLAQPEQEPVAWMDSDGNVSDNNDHNCFPIPLYTTPPQQEPVIDKSAAIRIATSLGWTPQRTWVDVPDEEIKRLWIQYRAALPRYLCFAKDLLSRSKEKNT